MDNNLLRSTAEWNALNKIWAACTQEQRTQLEAEFRFLTEFIRANTATRFTEPTPENYSYLQGLSSGAQSLIIEKEKDGERNLYHSMMSVINGKIPQGKDAVRTYYYEKYGSQRPYVKENWSLICEIFDFCWSKSLKKQQKRKG